MGFRSCPYNAIKACSWSEEVIRGSPNDVNSPFHWDCVVLNLPGTTNYNPMLPWLYKWNSTYECIAGDIFIYVDDIRPTGKDDDHCERVMHRTAARSNYLGQQDAPRKRRPPSQSPGLWSGSLVNTDNSNVYVSTSEAKWNRGKAIVWSWIKVYVEHDDKKLKDEPSFNHKQLEQGRGFLVHLGNTYPWLMPRLKGLHLTLDSWRPGRDSDGWKVKTSVEESTMDTGRRNADEMCGVQQYAPKSGVVQAVKRFRWDLLALGNLLADEHPPCRLVRGRKMLVVHYGFGDASGAGFGTSWKRSKGGVMIRYGVWGSDDGEQSSNYRELKNLVDSLVSLSKQENLEGTEVFLFTDNAVAESAFYKGSSSSLLLFNLILKLSILEKENKMKLHLIHVSGSRMIVQGTDGLSRGDMLEGVMAGTDMLDFVPINKSAIEVQPELKDWLKSWLPSDQVIDFLTPAQWFTRGHDIVGYSTNDEGIDVPILKSGIFVWAPPPAVADVAIKELRRARHKRQSSLHVFVCPRLMKPLWFKLAYRAADLMFVVKPVHSFWSQDRYEPLMLFVCFPFLRHQPWQLRSTPPLLEMARLLQQVQESGEPTFRYLLQQLFILTGKLSTMSAGMVRQMLYRQQHFHLPHQES